METNSTLTTTRTAEAVSTATVFMLVFIGFAAIVGHLAGRAYVRRYGAGKTRSPGFAIGIIVAAYCILALGVSYPFVSLYWEIGLCVTKFVPCITTVVTESEPGKSGAQKSSLFTLMEGRDATIACLIGAFALGIPVLKLVFFAIAELWRYSEDKSRVFKARRCIQFVRIISKWASPDMFVYIIACYLIDSFNDPPTSNADGTILLGFVAFTLYCLCSTVGFLCVPVPELADEVKEDKTLCGAQCKLIVSVALVIAMLRCLYAGLTEPCLSLRVKTWSTINTIPGLRNDIDKDISLMALIEEMVAWKSQGEFQALVCLAMVVVFGMLAPVSNLVVLLSICAHSAYADSRSDETVKSLSSRDTYPVHYWVTDFLDHIAMLDVMTVGILMTIPAIGPAVADDMTLSILWAGAGNLIAAAVLHFSLYRFVAG